MPFTLYFCSGRLAKKCLSVCRSAEEEKDRLCGCWSSYVNSRDDLDFHHHNLALSSKGKEGGKTFTPPFFSGVKTFISHSNHKHSQSVVSLHPELHGAHCSLSEEYWSLQCFSGTGGWGVHMWCISMLTMSLLLWITGLMSYFGNRLIWFLVILLALFQV